MQSSKNMWVRLRERNDDEDCGASLVEYAFLVALIAVVCLVAISFLGSSASSKYDHFGSCWHKAGEQHADMSDCR